MNKLITITVTILILQGCASKPSAIPTAYVSPLKYKDYDCAQIALEKQQVERQTTKLFHSLKKERTKDNWQVGLGLFIWPAFFLVEGGDGPAATEYAQLKGEYEALQDNAIAKKCELVFQQTQR